MEKQIKDGKDDGHRVQRPLRPLPKMFCLQKQKQKTQNWKYAIFKGMGKEGMSRKINDCGLIY